jgi:CBS domain-containing protein
MFSQRVRNVMEHDHMLIASPESLVTDAARLLAGSKLGAVLVVQGDQLTGIFTERDAVCRVLAMGLDAGKTTLASVMTPEPITVDPEGTFGHALLLMHEHGMRHVPVVEDGKPVGLVCARDALDPEMEEFACEAQRREGFSESAPLALLHKV